ncbi:hypothetical protein BDZ89DRAFT_400174 [Hymenopellis radicata]|nr:hypothetical protein BDZ89DRAFT_400174 [Hymenopellis radicata]
MSCDNDTPSPLYEQLGTYFRRNNSLNSPGCPFTCVRTVRALPGPSLGPGTIYHSSSDDFSVAFVGWLLIDSPFPFTRLIPGFFRKPERHTTFPTSFLLSTMFSVLVEATTHIYNSTAAHSLFISSLECRICFGSRHLPKSSVIRVYHSLISI